MEIGKIDFRKNGNWRIVFGKNYEKLAHLRNLAPKIIYAHQSVDVQTHHHKL
jgi:hypothetical protein